LKIPQSFIDQLLQRTDIIDLISTYVPLKQKGNNYLACCPFHGEKTPSFSVSPTKQFYYCFGCGVNGNAIGFLMAHEHLEFLEAVQELSKRCGLEIPTENAGAAPSQNTPLLYEYLSSAQHFFQQQLKQHPKASQAIEYLKKRGLSGETAKIFSLGFSPPEWDGLYNALGKTAADRTALQNAGLLIKNEQGRVYDRFRGRIIFPIRDHRGRVIGFGGRVMDNEEPKYLNSPETPVFQKGQALYGLYENKSYLPNASYVLIVEGYMDVIGLFQHGIRYALATLGTATTPHHLRILLRQSHHLIFCFDGDRAGQEAAWRALKVSLPYLDGSSDIRFLFLPEDEDPDSLIQKEGQAAFEQRCQNSQPLSNYLIEHIAQHLNLSTLEGKAKLMAELQPYLTLIPEGPYLSLLKAELEKRTGISEAHHSRRTPAETTPQSLWTGLSLEEQALVHLLHYPALALEIPHPRLTESSQNARLLNQLYTVLQTTKPAHAGLLLQQWSDADSQQQLAYFSTIEHPTHQEGNVALELTGIFKTLHEREQLSILDLLLEKAVHTELTVEEKQQLNQLLQKNRKS